ncbi:MAG: thermonuclease family protein [Phycisphaerae bacterium]|nr:thermonuclease family protein [Phycisphaerae bacterium]
MSRTQRNALIAAFFFILMPVLVVLDHQYGGHLRQAIEQTTYADADFQKYHRKTFTVLEVIDGDTIDINIPDGKHEDTRIRLIGVDTPETKHPTVGLMYYGPEATQYTMRQALGKQVTILLDTVSDQRDRYGRLLAYVVLPDGRVLNAELIKDGFAYAYLSFPHSEFTTYQALMEQAIAEKKGLWANAARDDLPKWLRSKRPDLLRH